MSDIVSLQRDLSAAIAARAPHPRIRSLRMAIAREKGTHTRAEWSALCDEFSGRCVRCGAVGHHLDRDHIIPVYQGGSDGIDNIQPLCARCNSSKGPEKFNWAEFRRENGFDAEIGG